jgi:hypothetical protein
LQPNIGVTKLLCDSLIVLGIENLKTDRLSVMPHSHLANEYETSFQ